MLIRFSFALLAAALLIGCSRNAEAADFVLTPVIASSYEPDFTPIPGPPVVERGTPKIYQVDFHVSTSNLQAGERGFGSVRFNVNFEGAISDAVDSGSAVGWTPYNPIADRNGPAPGGFHALYGTNSDGGPVSTDLQGVFASIVGGISNPYNGHPLVEASPDMRVRIGQSPIPPNPSLVGSIFVAWQGNDGGTLSVTDVEFTTYLNSGQFGAGSIAPSSSITFVPEPSTIAMAGIGLGMLVAVRMRRRKS